MKRILLVLLASAALMPVGPVTAAEVDLEAAFEVVGFLRSYGCSLNKVQVDLFLPEIGIDEATYSTILGDLVAGGFAEGDPANLDAGVVLTPAFCGPRASNDQRASLIEIMRYHDCRLTPADPARVLLPAGFMPDTVRPVIQEMVGAGEASIDAENTLILSEALCSR